MPNFIDQTMQLCDAIIKATEQSKATTGSSLIAADASERRRKTLQESFAECTDKTSEEIIALKKKLKAEFENISTLQEREIAQEYFLNLRELRRKPGKNSAVIHIEDELTQKLRIDFETLSEEQKTLATRIDTLECYLDEVIREKTIEGKIALANQDNCYELQVPLPDHFNPRVIAFILNKAYERQNEAHNPRPKEVPGGGLDIMEHLSWMERKKQQLNFSLSEDEKNLRITSNDKEPLIDWKMLRHEIDTHIRASATDLTCWNKRNSVRGECFELKTRDWFNLPLNILLQAKRSQPEYTAPDGVRRTGSELRQLMREDIHQHELGLPAHNASLITSDNNGSVEIHASAGISIFPDEHEALLGENGLGVLDALRNRDRQSRR